MKDGGGLDRKQKRLLIGKEGRDQLREKARPSLKYEAGFGA